MRRVVVLGRGGAGKSTASRRLGELLQAPVIELDGLFWSADLTPTPPQRWAALQGELAAGERWVMDGDLGPYDVLAPRLARADTVLLLDFGLGRCLWQAARRSRERLDFWWWVITWRRCSKPALLQTIATEAPQADLHILRTPSQLYRLISSAPN
jgi:adenylate kinase family enzyme